jgi:WD40 repeat protein
MVASGDEGGIIRIWYVLSGSLIQRLQNIRLTKTLYVKIGEPTSVHSLAFSPDGTKIISIDDESIIKFWDIASGIMINTIPTSDRPSSAVFTPRPSSVLFTPDGRKIIIGYSSDNRIDILDLETDTKRTIISGTYRSLQLSLDGTIILQASAPLYNKQFRTWSGGNQLKLIDVETGTTIRVIEDTHDLLYASISSDNKTILYTNVQGELKVCNADGTPIKTLTSGFTKFRTNKADETGFVSYGNGRIQLWNTTDNVPIQTLRAGRGVGLVDIDINKDDTKIAAACTDYNVYIFTDVAVSALRTTDIATSLALHEGRLNEDTQREIASYLAPLDNKSLIAHYDKTGPFKKSGGSKRKTIKGRKNKSKIKRKQSKKNKK